MTRRRTLLICLVLAVMAAAVFAVRSCTSPGPGVPDVPGGMDAPPVGEETPAGSARTPRRRVRDRDVAGEQGAAVDPLAATAEADAARAAARERPEPPPAPSCEFVITVSDTDGRRVPGVDVLVQGDTPRGRGLSSGSGLLDLQGLGRGEGASKTGVTDASGVVRITAPLFERMRVRATSDRWHGEAKAAQLSGPGPIELALTVVPGFRISGRVVHDDGVAVPDASVYIAVPLPGLAARHPRQLEIVGTDAKGHFRCSVHPVPDTRIVECYVVAATVAGTSTRFPVTAGAMEGVELIAPRGGVVRGRCVDEEGAPLGGVRVRGIKPATGEVTWSGDDGRFSMQIPGAGGGLIFFLEGRVQTGRRDLRGTPEGTDIGDVLIPRGGVLSGRLVDESGAALVGAAVLIVEPISEHAADTLRTGTDGGFRSELIGPGSHVLVVRYRREGDPAGPLSAILIDGFTAGTTDATVAVRPASWATLEVRDPDSGEPLVFETGAFTIWRRDAPEYTVAHHVFETKGETRSQFPFQIPGPGTYEIELELPETGAVERRRIVVGDDPLDTIVLTPR